MGDVQKDPWGRATSHELHTINVGMDLEVSDAVRKVKGNHELSLVIIILKDALVVD
jgi:hypothetical protein